METVLVGDLIRRVVGALRAAREPGGAQRLIGLKLLTKDGTSLREQGRVTYTGRWQTVPGNGTYLAVTDGLTVGSYGPTLAVFEADPKSRVQCDAPNGVECYTRVRWLKHWKPTTEDQRKAWAEWGKARAECDRAGAEYDRAGAEYNRAWAEYDKARAECNRAWAEYNGAGAEYNRAWAECDRAWAECNRAWAEWSKARAECDKARAEYDRAGAALVAAITEGEPAGHGATAQKEG